MDEKDKMDSEAINEEDLEDGEIESDEDNDGNELSTETSDTKKVKSADDTISTEKSSDTKNSKNADRNGSSSKSNKKQGATEGTAKKTAEDDWMGDVENAIAKALKKDGIQPKIPTIAPKAEEKKVSSGHKRKSKNKQKSDKEVQRKKAKLADEDSDKQFMQGSNESDDFDEYEMMNVRGGSPPAHGSQPNSQSQKQNMLYYDSDASYSSYDSYESNDHRSRRHRGKRRGNDRSSRRNHRGGNSKREKRRRNDSEDDIGSNPNNNVGGNGERNTQNRNNNNSGPRKAELCKFYLMECCAKGEKCLYMHGDFPCKFYYLGMKNHNRETCKFSHGKPLTDTLRNVLLKHLETAPKEIIGDFPRLSRENAINMLNAQHQKLLVKFGMEPDPSLNSPASTNQSVKLPSLLDLITKYPSPTNDQNSGLSSLNSNNAKKDKPRKSRWTINEIDSNAKSTMHAKEHSKSNVADENDVKISALGVLSAEQIEKLEKLGIETISQLTQLTVLQVIELGLNIAQITELQVKALSMQQQSKNSPAASPTPAPAPAPVSAPVPPPTEIRQTPFSPTAERPPAARDQDMRIPLSQSTGDIAKTTENPLLADLVNQDIDMRILTVPPPISNKISHSKSATHSIEQMSYGGKEIGGSGIVDQTISKADIKSQQRNIVNFGAFANNTQFSKQQNDQSSSVELQKIDYSQYLKDANLESMNQSDLEDQLGENSTSKEKKKNYYSDEDEADNSLVIEEEPLQIDESRDSDKNNDEERMSENDANSFNADDMKKHDNNNEDEKKSLGLTTGSLIGANVEDAILPAVYAPASIFPTVVTNKIDLSSSVSQYLKKGSSPKDIIKTDGHMAGINDSNDSSNENMPGHRSPISHQRNESGSASFKFFTLQIPETNHPAPQALDERVSDYDSCGESNVSRSIASPPRVKPARKSIYEWTDSDDEDDDGSRSANIRTLSDGDDSQDSRSKSSSFPVSKDKDMRLSSLFLDKDYSNGDIDLRLPFKPVMANYIPATEIDASITSHAPIAYSVKEVDIPKPDYSQLRRSIPNHENTLDPRLRRILRIKDEFQDIDNSLSVSKQSAFSSPTSDTETLHTSATSISSTPPVNVKSESVVRPRIDPRRPNVQMNTSSNTTNTPAPVSNQPSTQPRSLHLDIQNILQKSAWYKDCSSKQKIMVNQQLAIVSTELKKFHADPSENKIFDLSFVIQNQLLQEVLTNLGVYISEDGEFVQLDQTPSGKETSRSGNASGLVDLMSIPISNDIDLNMDFMRKQQQQQQQQQQQAMQQAMGVMGPAGRYLNAAAGPPMMGFGSVNMQGDVIRPGLLGIAPNMPMANPYNVFDPSHAVGNFDPFFNRAGANNDNRNNYRGNVGSGGARWSNNANNNTNRDASMRRNQFERNNQRRDSKK